MNQAIRQIIIPDNLVFPEKDRGVNLDCSHLAVDGVVFIGDDGTTMWVEKEPFTGRITEYDFTEAESLWAQAEALLNDPPEPEPYVPEQVTRAQGKAALIMVGLWQSVLDYWASISDPVEKELAGVALNDTIYWQRSSPFLNAAAQALGLSSEQLDALFQQASEIEL